MPSFPSAGAREAARDAGVVAVLHGLDSLEPSERAASAAAFAGLFASGGAEEHFITVRVSA